MDDKEIIKTGTTTIGIVCKEGIVLAADKRATAGNFISGNKFDKIHQIDDGMAVTIAGLVSDAQLLTKLIKAELKLKTIRSKTTATVKEAANLLASLSYHNIRKMSMVPGVVAFTLAGKDETGFHLYSIGVDGSITEEIDFTSDGSGSVFAYGVLETLFKKGMSMDEGVKLAMKGINAALQRDSASGSGFDIVTITKDGVKKILTREVETRVEA